MGARYPDKEMLKSWKGFDTSVKLCKQANTAGKTARYKALLDTLQTTFYKFEEDYEFYKTDAIKKVCKTEEAFNAVVEEDGAQVPVYPNNDAWSDVQMMRYVDTRDLLQDVLDAAPTDSSDKGVAAVKDDVNLIVEDFKSECQRIIDSITKLKREIDGYDDHEMAASAAMSYENIILKLQNRIDFDIRGKVKAKLALSEAAKDDDYNDDKISVKFAKFSREQISDLDSCSMLLVRKSAPRQEESKPLVADAPLVTTSASSKPREQVFLEKTKPPRFNGDSLEFPEFHRKWLSQVHKANLPEETEMDKLRDAIPKGSQGPTVWCQQA